MDINEARAKNKGKVIVWYPFNLGGQIKDRWMWCAELNGQVEDYDDKQVLINNALDLGLNVVVLTLHRDGNVTTKDIVR
jgi:hypothetical protein